MSLASVLFGVGAVLPQIPYLDPEEAELLDQYLDRKFRHEEIDRQADEIMRDVHQRCKAVNYAVGQRMRRARERGWA